MAKKQALTEGLRHTGMRRLPKGATTLMLPETPFFLALGVCSRSLLFGKLLCDDVGRRSRHKRIHLRRVKPRPSTTCILTGPQPLRLLRGDEADRWSDVRGKMCLLLSGLLLRLHAALIAKFVRGETLLQRLLGHVLEVPETDKSIATRLKSLVTHPRLRLPLCFVVVRAHGRRDGLH